MKTAYSVGFVWLGLNIIYYVHVCQEVLYSDMYSLYTNNCVLAVNITSVGKFSSILELEKINSYTNAKADASLNQELTGQFLMNISH